MTTKANKMPTKRQVKRPNYKEAAGSSEEEDESSGSQQKRRYPTKAKPTSTKSVANTRPRRAASNRRVVQDSSAEELEDDVIELPSSSSEDERPVATETRTSRRRLQPTRAARQQPKVVDISLSPQEEEEEEDTLEEDASEQEFSEGEEQPKTARKTHPFFASVRRTQPARAARLSLKETSSEEEEASIQMNTRMTRRNNPHTKTVRKPNTQVQPTRTLRQQQQKQTNKKVPRHVGKNPPRKRPKRDESSEELSVNDSSSSDDSSNDSAIEVELILACRQKARKEWKELGASQNTSEIDNGSRWKQESDSEDDADSDQEDRFLVKWKDLSYLHCSWEKRDDLVDETINGSELLADFCEDGKKNDENDSNLIDPSFLTIERILESTTGKDSLPIVYEKESELYEKGKGRRFCIKWHNLPECSYEFERDLILKEIPYESHLDSLIQGKKNKHTSLPATKGKQKKPPKSPAVQHSTMRCATPTTKCAKIDENVSSDDEEEDEPDNEVRIQRIIATRRETRQKWKEICAKMNTTEIDNGSRWFQDDDDDDDDCLNEWEERFLVKWADLSFLHCSWETIGDLKKLVARSSTALRNFQTKCPGGLYYSADERGDGDYFDPSYVEIDRILELGKDYVDCGIILDKNHPKFEHGTGRQFLIKWVNLPYTDISYEFERDLIVNDISYEEHFDLLQKRSSKPSKTAMPRGERATRRLYMSMFGEKAKGGEEREKKLKEFQDGICKMEFKNGGKLRDYQAEGVTWMLSNFLECRSMILADEMGLGKTIQTATFINYLATDVGKRGPFLIIAPLSTLPHWKREFDRWTNLNTIVYSGSADDRFTIRRLEFAFEEDRPDKYHPKQKYLAKCHKKGCKGNLKTWMVQVVITTPEYLIADDYSELEALDWEVLVVDEAHRLKNHASKLAVNLRNDGFRFGNILCLTGTPIQNTVHELWALLNFIDKKKFDSLESFSEKFGEIKSKETVNELHELIRPYILRRLKEDVEKSVPPKEETLIEVELTSLQKRYYRALYEKNVQYLYKNKKKLDMPSLSNLAMQLRKVCNSAFLVNGVETEFREQEQNSKQYTNEVDCLLKSSGKLVLLHKLLPKLKQEGHKVLIFSQFKVMLDIIEDYLSLTQFKFERIDGSITGHKRQSAIDRFQAKDEDGKEPPLVMLLTTKAGGVGITLTAADVCIIWDSDYNPQNDLQAQARCHRIGQTKSVTVYRLLSRKTYEQQLFHMASLKMGLDTAVLHGVENQKGSSKGKTELTKEEIEKLLRHGAYDIFNEEKAGTGEEESKAFQEANIDEILAQRAKKVVHENTGSHSAAAGGTFSKASFRLSLGKDSSSAKDTEQVDIDDPDFWVKMVGERVERSTPIILKRRRAMPNYRESGVGSQHSSSSSASVDDTSSNSSDSDDSAELTKITKEPRRWGGKLPGEWRKKDMKDIVEILQSFGYPDIPTSAVLAKLVSFHGENEVKRMLSSIVLFTLKEAAELESKVLCKRQIENETTSATPDENQETDVGMQDANASECRLSRDFSPSKEHLEEAFLAIAKQHSLFFSKIMEDIMGWTAGRTPRSSNSNSTEENLNISIFSEWNALAQFLIDYAPSQLVYNRSNSRSISLQRTLLDVCSLAFAARQAVFNADTLFRDQSTRKSDDDDLNLALTLKTCTINAFIPSSSWRPRHDGVLVRAIAKHGLPNSASAYNKLKTDASIKWTHIPSEAESKDSGSLDFALHYTHLSETACEAALMLSSAGGLFVDVNRVSKLLCLQKENGGWVVNKEALRRFFYFSLPSRTDLIARAKTIFGMDKAVKINHGFTELDQFNQRNILVKEMLLWLINAKISRSSLQDWNIGASKAIFECNRLAEKYSDDSMLSISEHIQSVLNTKDLRKNNRVVKNVLRAILGLEPLIKSKNPSIFPSTNNDRTSTDSFDKQVTEQVPLSNPQDKSQTGVKQSWAEAAIDRCSKLSGLKSGTGNAFDADSKRLSLTVTEEQLLKILSSHGIPVWQNGWADLTDSTSKNELTWDWLASKLYSLMKIWLTQSVAICDNAKSSLQGYEKKAELSGLSDDQKKIKLQTRYSTAVSTMEAIKSILPDCELLCSRPADFGRKSVMLLQAVLNTADLNEYKLKGNKAGKVADSLGLGVLKWGRSELKRWAESLDLVDNDTRNPLSAVAIEYMQKQGSQLEVTAKLDKKSCRVIHCQVFQQTRLRSISLSHGTDEFGQMVSKASLELEKGSPWQGRPLEWATGLDDLKLVDGILNYGYGSFDTLTQPDSGLPSISIDAAQMRLVQLCRELHHLHVSHERMQIAHSSAAFDSSKPIANKQTLIGSFFFSGPSKEKPIRLDNSEKVESGQTQCQLTEPLDENKHAKVVADIDMSLSNNLGRKRSLFENESMIEIPSSSDEDEKKRSRLSH